MTHTYKITGMTCNGCKASVEKVLLMFANVEDVSVDLETSRVTIKMSEYIPTEDFQNKLPNKYSITEDEKTNVFKPSPTPKSVEKSELKQLFPLFLIFGYITTASIILHYNDWSWSEFMLDFMGLFYIVFSFFKFLDLRGFSESFKMYDPLAKLIPSYGLLYPFVELTLGLLFLMRLQIPSALIITIIILGITTIGVTKTLLNKTIIQCACLGTALKLPMTKATFIENSIMLIMAVVMLINIYK